MLLRIDDLQTHFDTPGGMVRAVDGVSLEIQRGETLALVGESGCGKTLTALSVLDLVPPPGRVVSGRVIFDNRDLRALRARQLRAIRGDRIAMIFQEPMTSLNPLLTAGAQISEALRLHRRVSARTARQRTVELLRRVGIPAPEQRARDYPHQLSGGMRQRVMIAMALACEPELLIADEPTTALDVTVQAQVLALLHDLQRQTGMAMLFITHDLSLVAHIADTLCVMYAGRIVERAGVAEVFSAPQHPYTRGLLQSTPHLGRLTGAEPPRAAQTAPQRLPVIPGDVPAALGRPSGCAFHPRCESGHAEPTCHTRQPPLVETAPAHACACWKAPGQTSGCAPRAYNRPS